MTLREEIAIKLAAIDLGQVANFDANLFADEIIAKVRECDDWSYSLKAEYLKGYGRGEKEGRAKTIEACVAAVAKAFNDYHKEWHPASEKHVLIDECHAWIRHAIKGVGDE